MRPAMAIPALLGLLASTTAAQQDAPATQAQIDAAIERGTAYLLSRYGDTFERGDLAGRERPGETALSLYTLLKAGVAKDDPVMQALIDQISFAGFTQTYDTACALLALYAHDPIADRPWIEQLAAKLLEWQLETGGWGYPGGCDLSNTQFAAFGLRAASKSGVAIAPEVWERLAKAALDHQRNDGGFQYNDGHRASSGSMTVAGIGILAICETELRRAGRWPDKLARTCDAARDDGLEWLIRHFDVTANPGYGGAHFYYLYGLERFGALTGVARVGTRDWYEEGATFLVETQDERGYWHHTGNAIDTCFALLFLRRATAGDSRLGPVTGGGRAAAVLETGVSIAATGDGLVTLWIDAWNRNMLRAVEWPEERGHGPRVVRVEYFADGHLIGVELGDPTRACDGARFATQHVFTGSGKHRVRARVHVRAPNKASSSQVLESQELEVEVARAWLPLAKGAKGAKGAAGSETELGPNLLATADAKAQASSEAGGTRAPFGRDFSAKFAIDGRVQTPWLAAGGDGRRTVSVSLAKAIACDVVRIAPAFLAALGPDYLSRPIEVEVQINDKLTHRLVMSPDPTRAVDLELDRPIAVKRLDVRIVHVAESEHSPLVGIGEIELFARR